MADEDTRSSGGGMAQEDDKFPSIETDVDTGSASPGGGSGASLPPQHPDQDSLDKPQGGRPSSPGSGHSGRTPLLDIHKGRPIRLQVRVLVPIKDHPNYNFVGKLLGPKGNSLKRLQEESQTKMAILGRGSMRDRAKEEELRATGDPKHGHLRDDLHVEITAFAPAAEAYARMAHALAEVKRFLVPDYYDEIRQNQLRELAVLNGNRKRGHKITSPESTDFEADVVSPQQQDCVRQPPFVQQQRLQVPLNGSASHHGGQGVAGSRQVRCGLVTRSTGAALVGRAVRAAPHRGGGGGLVRSFVTSVCGGAPPTLFREVTLASPAPGAEAARIKYLTQEDAFTFEDGFGEPQRADEFSIRSSQAYIGHDYRDDDDEADGLYESHNGYAAKDFIGEDWPQPKGSPGASASSPVAPIRGGPSAGRLKTVASSPAPVRPPRAIYREHPYFPTAVARY